MSDYELNLYKKIRSDENLNERELNDLLEYLIEEEYIDSGRWQSFHVGYFKDDLGQWWQLNYALGLTENQENEFYEQPQKVNRIEKEVTKIEVSWELLIKD